PLNPFQFNYAEYLSNKYIYGQVMLNENNYFKLPHQTNSILGLADTIRTTINNRLLSSGINGDPLAIINALLLGQRQDIDDTIYNNYVNAGVIHILAVSGLHVGLLLIILNYLFKPLLYFKHGKIIKLVLLILFLWSFAVIAGLSASVTRAVAMFSIVTIAYFYRRATNIYNTLAISAFFILLIKPSFLFEVGFQLSYLAVIAIVSIQPLIYRLWRPKKKLLDRLWQIFTVTLAAQFGVVPISLYYFHQFPGLFFVSNLVIIPLLGIILGLGLFVILLALLNILHPIIALVFSSIINYLNNFISWIASFETFLLQDLSFGLLQMVSAYVVIIAFTYFAKTKSFRGAIASLFCVVFLQSASMYYKIANSNDELVIFNKSRSSLLLSKQNDRVTLYSDFDDTIVERLKPVKDYMVGRYVSASEAKPLKNVYTINSKVVLVVDSMGIYNTESFKPDFVLLRNSPKINIYRLLTELNPELVIADASNYRTYVQRWKATCTKQKVPFHYTYEKGAFIYP
ncbi:MAG: ComEC/Rec2 family competence protein, partial [Winogradskyella sp.]|nr:ComEC/Rec2 family competence protein [Winogradskyella sp.]